jgi:hypothetical protein
LSGAAAASGTRAPEVASAFARSALLALTA